MMVTNIQVKTFEKKFEDLSKRFEKTCSFCDGDFNKFCIELQKGV